MKSVELKPGVIVLVDDTDEQILTSHKWHIWNRRVIRCFKGKLISLSREIAKAPPGAVVDHANGNPLDNRRCNLRVCGYSENGWNTPKRMSRKTTSKYKGVSFEARKGLWRARLTKKYKNKSLGYHRTEVEAAKAYNAGACALYGEFALLNDIG